MHRSCHSPSSAATGLAQAIAALLVTEAHSSVTDDFEASAAKAIGVRSDEEGTLGAHDGLTVAATVTDSLWRCLRVAEAAEG